MTVKELREALAAYKDDALVAIECEPAGSSACHEVVHVYTGMSRSGDERRRRTVSLMGAGEYRNMENR